MWPVLFEIDGFRIGTFGLMVAVGFFMSYLVGMRRVREAGFPEDRFSTFVVLTLLAGIVGAKLLFVWVYLGQAPVRHLFFSRSGLVFYGGLLTGVPTGWWLTKRNGWDPAEVADLVASVIPLGHFFGRIGCFLNGCCYGRVCNAWYGVSFPRLMENGRIVGSEPFLHQLELGLISPRQTHSLPVYPTQLLSAAGHLIIFVILFFYVSKRSSFKGQTALVYLLLYSAFRFCVEILRDDPRGIWPGGLSTSQGIAVALAVLALLLWKPLKKRGSIHPDGNGGTE